MIFRLLIAFLGLALLFAAGTPTISHHVHRMWVGFVASGRFASEAGVVTLAQAKLNATDDIDVAVIDEFRKESWLLDTLQFDDVVNPAGGGGTLTYGYTRLITQPTAAFRAINAEYTPQEVTKARYTVDLKPLGGSFQIDRVLARVGSVAAGEVNLQMSQKIKATQTQFMDSAINGDTNVDANGFDGLDKALVGTATEMNADTATDWSALDEAGSFTALDTLDTFLALLDGEPTAIISNRKALLKIASIARRAGYFTRDRNEFGRNIERYGNIVLIDPGKKSGTNDDIVPIVTRDIDNTVYVVTVTGGPGGGTFSLNVTYNGTTEETAAIAYNATAAAVQAAIEALTIVPTGGVTVTGSAGGAWTVTFGGALTDEVLTVALSDNNLTGGTTPSVTTVESANTANTTGTTDLYAVRLGLDGFHGISMAGGPLIQKWLPDFTTAGAVKTGEVEMGPVAVVLKATKAAAVLRNLKVQ
jgi:hypothetical protein